METSLGKKREKNVLKKNKALTRRAGEQLKEGADVLEARGLKVPGAAVEGQRGLCFGLCL